jgi:molybdate transport system permease protein
MSIARADRPFLIGLGILGGGYVALLGALVAADLCYASPGDLVRALASPEIRFAVRLTLVTTAISTLLSLLSAVPLGYLLSRRRFAGRGLLDAMVDIPIVLPPLVVGLSLLILFRRAPLQALGLTFNASAVVLAQFVVSAAFATRTLKAAFDQIPSRTEDVAMTLGCTRAQAFFRVTLPEARRGIVAAATVAWARALGEFGPVLVFAGATRMRTEVLATTVFLELSVGRLEAAVAVSIVMIATAGLVLAVLRRSGRP